MNIDATSRLERVAKGNQPPNTEMSTGAAMVASSACTASSVPFWSARNSSPGRTLHEAGDPHDENAGHGAEDQDRQDARARELELLAQRHVQVGIRDGRGQAGAAGGSARRCRCRT
jgi:hypothetical protein